MTFLEREYLDFKLRQVLAGEVDFDLESDWDNDSDDNDSSGTSSDHTGHEDQHHSGTFASSSSVEYTSDDDSYDSDAPEPDADVWVGGVGPPRVERGFAERPSGVVGV